MDLAALTMTEMLELKQTNSSWNVRRSQTDLPAEAAPAIDNFHEMIQQIERSLCRRS